MTELSVARAELSVAINRGELAVTMDDSRRTAESDWRELTGGKAGALRRLGVRVCRFADAVLRVLTLSSAGALTHVEAAATGLSTGCGAVLNTCLYSTARKKSLALQNVASGSSLSVRRTEAARHNQASWRTETGRASILPWERDTGTLEPWTSTLLRNSISI